MEVESNRLITGNPADVINFGRSEDHVPAGRNPALQRRSLHRWGGLTRVSSQMLGTGVTWREVRVMLLGRRGESGGEERCFFRVFGFLGFVDGY